MNLSNDSEIVELIRHGVSGGERKCVTVAEVAVTLVPILCCDEISTGLDGKKKFSVAILTSGTIQYISGGQPHRFILGAEHATISER